MLDRLATGLEMGVELIRSLVDFVVRKTKEALSSDQLGEFKEYVKLQAAQFGKSLFDVTGKVSDLLRGGAEKAGELAEQAADAVLAGARSAGDATKDVADTALEAGKRMLGRTTDRTPEASSAHALRSDDKKP